MPVQMIYLSSTFMKCLYLQASCLAALQRACLAIGATVLTTYVYPEHVLYVPIDTVLYMMYQNRSSYVANENLTPHIMTSKGLHALLTSKLYT